ncbi:MAG TPA: hypothetical protein VFO73_14275 [Candidatus Limnocylindrales bacterium]|nr:hypothetical protein [Candidatus Limnocylindrales bacterium]
MRIRRGLLFWGFFLIPLGALPLLVRAGILDPETFAQGWRLWPLILVAIGIAIVVGRSRLAVLGTAAVAIVLGLAVGGVLAGGNFWLDVVTDCGFGDRTEAQASETGAFQGPASLDLDLRCGSVDLTTGGTTGWTFDADYRGQPPVLNAGGDRLSVRAPADGRTQRHEWTLTVAPTLLREVNLTTNAAGATFDLAGTELASVTANVNAGELVIDAGSATVGDVNLEMNAGRIGLSLGSGPVEGSLQVNAGAIDLCVPDGVALRFRVNDQLTFVHNLGERGLSRDGDAWTRGGSTGGTIDLDVEGNAASFTLNPTGGCR